MRTRVDITRDEQWWVTAVERYRDGWSLDRIATEQGGSRTHLSKGLRARGVEVAPRGRPPAAVDPAEVMRMLRNGGSVRSVAQRLRTDRSRIRAIRDEQQAAS